MFKRIQRLIEDYIPAKAPPPDRMSRWLRVARAVWLILAVAALLILLTSLPGYVVESGGQLAQITPDSRGGAATALIVLSALASLASALLSLTLAVLFFRRRFADPVAAALSFYLLCYAIVMAGPLEMWSLFWQGDASLALTLQGVLIAVPSVALFSMFPNGRFVPAWTRWLLLLSVLWCVPLILLPPMGAQSAARTSPVVLGLLGLWLVGLLGAGLYAQVFRYRHVSTRTEREQTMWVVYGFALWLGYLLLASIPYLYLVSLPADAPVPWWAPVSVLGWWLSLNIVPVSLAIAVTRYRLWDIHVVVNRTLVYVALTGCVLGIYIVSIVAMALAFQSQANWLITLIATGLVAVLFEPIRRFLQGRVNTFLYGGRDEPFEVLVQLGQRLEGTLPPELVLPTMVETISQTLKLPYVAIAARRGERQEVCESYGIPGGATHAYPLTYRGAVIGELQVSRRAPGESFTAREERLLRDIARQAGTAVRALQLTADLQRARHEVVASREEERRRLRRDLHDDLGPSLAAQMLKVGSARAQLEGKPEAAASLLAEVETDIETTLADLRRIVYDLRPPALDQLGLAGALRAYVESAEGGRSDGDVPDLTIDVDVPDALPPLPAAVEVAAYHIAREAITNVLHHAEASHCTLRLALDQGRDSSLYLTIQDDGAGLAQSNHTGVGLMSMRERAEELGGTFTIKAGPEMGTRVTARLPLQV